MYYVLKNDKAHGLGTFPLLPGKARVFQDDGRGSTAFLGEDWMGFTPRDDEARLYLGLAKDVVVKRTIESRNKIRVLGNLYNYDITIKYEIENFKNKPVVLDLAESMSAVRAELVGANSRPVDWELVGDGTVNEMVDTEKSTADRPLFHLPLPARGPNDKAAKQVHRLHVIIKNEW